MLRQKCAEAYPGGTLSQADLYELATSADVAIPPSAVDKVLQLGDFNADGVVWKEFVVLLLSLEGEVRRARNQFRLICASRNWAVVGLDCTVLWSNQQILLPSFLASWRGVDASDSGWSVCRMFCNQCSFSSRFSATRVTAR
eukprot:SAG31_NODE_5569_length_2452_cov_1.940501_1_plen_142_part_00